MTAREAIQEIVKDTVRNRVYVGKVKDVAGGFCTVIDLDDENHELLAVRIQSNPGNGLLPTPAIDSIVVVEEIQPFDYAIILYSSLSAIQWLDGSYGGLVRVAALTSKLNALEQKVNALISAYNGHVHAGVTAGAGSSGVTTSTISGTLTETQRGDIENTDIIHGPK